MEIITKSLNQTKKTGKILAQETLKTKTEKSIIFGLKGDLGSGKTAFTQGFARGLGIKEKISSPTFVLMKKFKIPVKFKKQKNDSKKIITKDKKKVKKLNFESLYHFDFYRIKTKKEILSLGFQEIVSNPKNIIIIEWPKLVTGSTCHKHQNTSQAHFIEINFEFIDLKTRKITSPPNPTPGVGL